MFTLLPGSAEAFVPLRSSQDGTASLADWVCNHIAQILFSGAVGQQSWCLAWASQLVSFPGKHAEAGTCKKKPSWWVIHGPWCFLKLSQRWSTALWTAGVMMQRAVCFRIRW